jgi:uroporphyrinogen III methyltransferase/synthase
VTPGTVFLVGAGPGDPGLMTVRAVELIARADVILHDRLVPARALAGARRDAELVYVGKQGGGPQMAQEEIHTLLLEHARAGRSVVRLKGGDPFVFGRGGEEALVCLDAGIPFEVVPGITAGVAAPAYAGIPVTHRELASGVAFVTGHEDPAKPDSTLDWPALAAFPGTLVFYMGVRALPRIAEQLMTGGRPPDQSVAVIERGTLPGQRTLLATLADVAERAAAAAIRAPAITLVGAVAGLREQLAWVEKLPLHGRTVAVTRARPQASELAARLRELGADVIEAPAIRVRSVEAELPDLTAYDLICVTSPNGAHALFTRLPVA